MSRISLVFPSDGLCYKFARNRTRRMPLGLAYIAAALEREDHDIKITDGSLHDLDSVETAERALQNDPEFVGIGCTTPIYHQAVAVIDEVKRRSPSVKVILGGPHVSALPVPSLRTSKADVVCIGEGEESAVGVVDALSLGKSLSSVTGIAYRSGDDIKETQRYRTRAEQKKDETVRAIDLDRIPIPARHLFDFNSYVDFARDVYEPQTGAVFTRGCPGRCGFCGAAGTLIRVRSLDNVIEELETISRLGIKNVFVMDDTYTNNKKRVLELSRRIAERNLSLSLSVQLRLDQVDREVCDALFASGVKYVGPGIESGNEEIMKAIGKGPKESKKHMLEKVRLLQEYDWRVRCSFVMGMVGETEAQIMETIQFAKELGADENAFSILVPYPDSPLWAVAKSRGQVDDYMDFSKFLYYHEIGCNLSEVPTERLLELHEFAYEYVGNPAYKLDDTSISSGHRPHVPYLASEEFQRYRARIGGRKEKGKIGDM